MQQELSSRPSAIYHVLLTKMPFLYYKTSDTKKIVDLIWMKILNSDRQCVFRIILVKKTAICKT